jgi:hypothetical protein
VGGGFGRRPLESLACRVFRRASLIPNTSSYEPESGRIHPVEHDGNEAFVLGDVQLSPVQGSTGGQLLSRTR